MKKLCLCLSVNSAVAIVFVLFQVNSAFGQSTEKPVYLTPAQSIEVMFRRVETVLIKTAEAMPADKYPFAPTTGEFKGVRTFGQQVKHLSATNFILAAAALGEKPPVETGDETGPDTVRTKAEIINYLKASFGYLHKAMNAIDEKNQVIKSSSISPMLDGTATRLGLVVEALVHAYDHYGQMVVYLRMNSVIPPASL